MDASEISRRARQGDPEIAAWPHHGLGEDDPRRKSLAYPMPGEIRRIDVDPSPEHDGTAVHTPFGWRMIWATVAASAG